jgi:hypothetical protein
VGLPFRSPKRSVASVTFRTLGDSFTGPARAEAGHPGRNASYEASIGRRTTRRAGFVTKREMRFWGHWV